MQFRFYKRNKPILHVLRYVAKTWPNLNCVLSFNLEKQDFRTAEERAVTILSCCADEREFYFTLEQKWDSNNTWRKRQHVPTTTFYIHVHGNVRKRDSVSFVIQREFDVTVFQLLLNCCCELVIKFRAEVIFPVSRDTLKHAERFSQGQKE